MIKHAEEKIKGGLAEGRPDRDFDADQLAMGMEVEKEHVNDAARAKEIAKDHLVEVPDYYTRLKKMEEEAKMKNSGKSKKILITTNRPDKVSVKASALRRAEVLSILSREGFGFCGRMLTPYRAKAAAMLDAVSKETEKECPGGKIRSGGKGRGLGFGKGKGPIGKPFGAKKENGGGKEEEEEKEAGSVPPRKGPLSKKSGLANMALHVFLTKALDPAGAAEIVKHASDRKRAARVLVAVHKAARAHAG